MNIYIDINSSVINLYQTKSTIAIHKAVEIETYWYGKKYDLIYNNEDINNCCSIYMR
jgi:hypothetical protein